MIPQDLSKDTVLKMKQDKIVVQPEIRFTVASQYYTFMKIEVPYSTLNTHGISVCFSKDQETWSEACPRSVAWIIENYEKIQIKPKAHRNRLEEVEE